LVNLERLKNVAGGLPVVGNIIALVSVAMDIRELYEKKSADVLDYVDIGVDLIGVVPIPPSLAAMRMSLRPMLGMVRGELVAQGKMLAKDYAKATLSDTLVGLLADHLNATIIGDLETFVREAQTRLDQVLKDAGELLEKMLYQLADGMKQVAMGTLDAQGDARLATRQASEAAAALVHDPLKSFETGWHALWHAHKAGLETASNEVVHAMTSEKDRVVIGLAVEAELRKMAVMCRKALAALADPHAGAIAKLLNVLLSVIVAWRKKKKGKGANVREQEISQAKKQNGKGQLEEQKVESGARSDPEPWALM